MPAAVAASNWPPSGWTVDDSLLWLDPAPPGAELAVVPAARSAPWPPPTWTIEDCLDWFGIIDSNALTKVFSASEIRDAMGRWTVGGAGSRVLHVVASRTGRDGALVVHAVTADAEAAGAAEAEHARAERVTLTSPAGKNGVRLHLIRTGAGNGEIHAGFDAKGVATIHATELSEANWAAHGPTNGELDHLAYDDSAALAAAWNAHHPDIRISAAPSGEIYFYKVSQKPGESLASAVARRETEIREFRDQHFPPDEKASYPGLQQANAYFAGTRPDLQVSVTSHPIAGAKEAKKGLKTPRAIIDEPSHHQVGESSAAMADDFTDPDMVPAEGTPERAFHDGLRRAAAHFGPDAAVQVQYRKTGKPYSFQVHTGNALDTIERSINMSRKTVSHDYFQINNLETRGSGAAKSFLADSVNAYKHLGIESVSVHANIDVGGYAWLRYGFKPNKGTRELATMAEGSLRSLRAKNAISDTVLVNCQAMIQDRDFNRLAAIKTSVHDGKVSMPLGKRLFLGSDWHGKLDMTDKTSMDRFFEYAGRTG